MTNDQVPGHTFPDGIDHRDIDRGNGFSRHTGIIALFLLLALLGTALGGWLGGASSPMRTVSAPAVDLAVHAPAILRNGMFFETTIAVAARRPIADLKVAVDASLWRDLTVNTMIPAPADERGEDGRFLFSYGALAPGKPLTVKVDSQINPALVGGTAGTIAVYDGDTLLAALPVTMKVRP